jgi:CRP-like cAMP-binding protein
VALGATVLGNLAASLVISVAGLSWALALIGIGFPIVAVACLPALISSDRTTAERTRSLQPVVALLERLDLFDGASRRVLEQLAGGAARRTAERGEVLISQGAEPDALWLLASGSLGIEADGVGLPVVAAPGYVGELGLMNNAPRSATVTVLEPSEVVRIDADDFRDAVASAASSSSMITLAGERLARTARREAASPAVAG